jgi:cyclopropane fatty-acyl-phospholipid synthase-like methyltransferase
VNPNQALWEKGDFTRIAATMRESGEALVQRIGIKKGMQVLDLGCGDGTTALPAAKLGANVVGVDIAQPGGSREQTRSGTRPNEPKISGRRRGQSQGIARSSV